MNRKLLLLAGSLLVASFGMSAPAFANSEIEERAKNENLWPAPGRDNQLTRHSKLKDINTKTVDKMQMVWTQSMNSTRGQEGQPVVVEHRRRDRKVLPLDRNARGPLIVERFGRREHGGG